MSDSGDKLRRGDRQDGSSHAPAIAADSAKVAAALPAAQLYRPADLSGLSFRTTDDLETIDGLVGQQRALSALEFGTRIRRPGFNLFVVGSSGARMQRAVESVLRGAPPPETAPVDWVYVNNFSDPRKPVAIKLPAGRAAALRDAMHALIEDLKSALPALFESEDYQTRRNAIDQGFQTKQAEAFSALRE
jgi:hypothetical protein